MNCLKPNVERLERRKFTPHDINLCDWKQVARIYDELLQRPMESPEDLEKYYLDVCDFNSAMTEEFCRIQLATSVDTEDHEARKRFAHFNEKVMAPASELTVKLDNRFLDSPFLDQLDSEQYSQLIRLLKNSRELFQRENIPLQIRDSQLAEEYNQISGGLSTEFEGKQQNLSELSVYQKSTDRSIREKAWRTAAECRSEKVNELNRIYSEMIQVRNKIALNAGFANYRDFRHLNLNRFDYSPIDCAEFHNVVEERVVTALKRRNQLRQKRLGVETLKPWDLSVDPFGRQPLKPFGSQEELVTGCSAILDRIYPKLGDTLRLLQAYGNLDLMTRKNKAPVGFNMPLDETRVSFVFMNATGHHNDLVVLLHESGHAVETRACINQDIMQYRHTPQEWGECASQSMELLALDHLDVFYPDEETRVRCEVDKLESILTSLVYTARIDAFQHWVYTNPEHTDEERAQKWLELSRKYHVGGDYTGLEKTLKWSWQGIPHLFIVPFYYIEYGIAQMGAIQVYRRAKTDGFAALEKWLKTMKAGYSKSIPELYERAGLRFEFHGDFAAELIDFLLSELNTLDEQ